MENCMFVLSTLALISLPLATFSKKSLLHCSMQPASDRAGKSSFSRMAT